MYGPVNIVIKKDDRVDGSVTLVTIYETDLGKVAIQPADTQALSLFDLVGMLLHLLLDGVGPNGRDQ